MNVRLETVSVIDREVELIREALAIAKRESEQLSLAVTSERQLIQVHEAGHAVIAFLLGHHRGSLPEADRRRRSWQRSLTPRWRTR